MLFFYEGLPRSGKSYSAVKEYIVPMLAKERTVIAYVEGLNHEKLAELAGITEEKCRELLLPLSREQVPEIYKHVKPDAFVVIDELQNFWPKGRRQLSPEVIQFITEHGHQGLDILCMGQEMKDCHDMWTNRMATKSYFQKQELFGKPDQYKVSIYKPVKNGERVKWNLVQTLKAQSYDPKYFGAYKSHTDETENKSDLVDQSAVIWNHPFFKRWLPLFGVVFIVAIVYLYRFFHGGMVDSVSKGQPKKETVALSQPGQIKDIPSPEKKEGAQVVQLPEEPQDVIDKYNDKYRLRLAAAVYIRGKTSGLIEWRGESFDLVDRMSIHDLVSMGWGVFLNESGTIAYLQKGSRHYIATSWPLPDPSGKVPQAQQERIKPPQEPQQVAMDMPQPDIAAEPDDFGAPQHHIKQAMK